VSGGFVSLVGAGPGDPQLLTRAAYDRLERAELVLYDALVSQDVLALAPRAQRFYVGKRAGRTSMSQETINRLLVRAARRGRRVVRLKAGDPFVFGRGGEEALALAAAGVAFEVVPGVTAAIAAPALAGIPVTHRGAASAFVTVSGHDERAWAPVLEALPPHSATIVVMMGLRSRHDLAGRLIARGWDITTPAAVLVAASTPRGQTWMGSLGDLAGYGPSASSDGEGYGDGAGTIVIGEVVRVGQQLARSLAPLARRTGWEPDDADSELTAAPAGAGRAIAR
jgi:uroporphyrin-III C-methyltransferase / precorrin-2 dehydrogenase / sirohydrochlorin ferrochelatase